jgi:hypothetical protein
MPEETMTAGGLPVVEAEPVPSEAAGLMTTVFRGSWCSEGGGVEKRGEYGVLRSRSGLTIMADRRATELLCLAHGIPLPKLRTVCAWCEALMNEGPLDEHGRESHGICDPCLAKKRAESRPSAGTGR